MRSSRLVANIPNNVISTLFIYGHFQTSFHHRCFHYFSFPGKPQSGSAPTSVFSSSTLFVTSFSLKPYYSFLLSFTYLTFRRRCHGLLPLLSSSSTSTMFSLFVSRLAESIKIIKTKRNLRHLVIVKRRGQHRVTLVPQTVDEEKGRGRLTHQPRHATALCGAADHSCLIRRRICQIGMLRICD